MHGGLAYHCRRVQASLELPQPLDGKHVVIQAPDNSGSLYYNYKGTYSIVLLAMVDADYLFRVVDVGGYGRKSDGVSLYNSAFGEGLRDGTLDLPESVVIPGSEHHGEMPFVFVGDEAFPLRRNLMRPFPGEQRVYNYRLSHARLVVECAFGILSSQWRMYRRVGEGTGQVVTVGLVMVAVSGEFPGCLLTTPHGRALRVRRNYTSYFSGEGAVPWQVQP